MRAAWLVLLVVLLPARVAWRGSMNACCEEACTCAAARAASCCGDEDAGPVVVAACDCGVPHGPSHVHRTPCDGIAPAPVAVLTRDLTIARLDLRAEQRPASRVVAPEPPPPRHAGG